MAFLLIPSEVIPFERGKTCARPKYVQDLGISFASCDLHRFGYFLVNVSDEDSTVLLKKSDVIDADDDKAFDKIKNKFDMKTKGADLVTQLGKLSVADFKKDEVKRG